MNAIKTWLLFSFFFILIISCDDNQTPATENQEKTTNTTAVTAIEEVPLIIFQHSFLNISPGSQIEEHKAILEQAILETEEGSLQVYNILDAKKNVVAYFLADPLDPELVRDIYITSPLAHTEDAIRIGDTFGDLATKHPEVEVYFSKIESRTVATLGSLSFKIDAVHPTDNLDISAISKEAKILEIVLER